MKRELDDENQTERTYHNFYLTLVAPLSEISLKRSSLDALLFASSSIYPFMIKPLYIYTCAQNCCVIHKTLSISKRTHKQKKNKIKK